MQLTTKISPWVALPATFVLVAMLAPAPAALIVGPTPIDTLPFVINSSGAYCVVGNLSGPGGITVNADHVDIDLAGFTLEGPGPGVEAIGIDCGFDVDNVRVHGGTLTDWGQYGLSLGNGSVAEDLSILDCNSGAILFQDCRMENCEIKRPEHLGIRTSNRCLIRDCQIWSLSEDAILVDLGNESTAIDIQARGGRYGFTGTNDVQLERCTSSYPTYRGFEFSNHNRFLNCRYVQDSEPGDDIGLYAGGFALVDGFIASNAGLHGIQTTSHSQVLRSTVSRSGSTGIRVLEHSIVQDCIVDSCNQEGASQIGGIHGMSGTAVLNSTISACIGDGLQLGGTGGVARHNRVFGSGSIGIAVSNRTLVEGNTVQDNQGFGLFVKERDNVVLDNVVDNNAQGLVVPGQRNVIAGNRVAENSGDDFDVLWGNAIGEIRAHDAQILGSHPQLNYGRE